MDKLVKFKDNIIKNISQVIAGKEREIELLIVAFLSGGHVLLEDFPRSGKTIISKALAKTLHLQFNKMDFTSDLLVTDITGINFYNPLTGDFQFKEGPLFSNVLLIDDINRATPKTQSVLLEAMEEKQITIDGLTRQLPLPFMVLASQSDLDTFGNFPLPQAKLDRFFMRIKLEPMRKEEEKKTITEDSYYDLNKLKSVVNYKELLELMEAIKYIDIDERTMDYLIEIIDETRKIKDLDLGISPRGSINLYKASRAYAAINGRGYIRAKDVELMAPYVLNHIIRAKGIEGFDESTVFIKDMVSNIKAPIYDD